MGDETNLMMTTTSTKIVLSSVLSYLIDRVHSQQIKKIFIS